MKNWIQFVVISSLIEFHFGIDEFHSLNNLKVIGNSKRLILMAGILSKLNLFKIID